MKELGFEGAKPSVVPGSKDEQKNVTPSARKVDEVEDNVDSVQQARRSAGDEVWETNGEASGIALDGDDEDELLGPEEARRYRGVAARLNYIAPDRPDIGYAVKEAARSMSAPGATGLRQLRKIGKYLIGAPRLVISSPGRNLRIG